MPRLQKHGEDYMRIKTEVIQLTEMLTEELPKIRKTLEKIEANMENKQ